MNFSQLIGGSYKGLSEAADAERSINWFTERIESDTGTTKTSRILVPRSGLAQFAELTAPYLASGAREYAGMAEYLMKEGSGTLAHDSGGNSRDAAFTSGTLGSVTEHAPTWDASGLTFLRDPSGSPAGWLVLPDAVLANNDTTVVDFAVEFWYSPDFGIHWAYSGGAVLTLTSNFVLSITEPVTPGGSGRLDADIWGGTGGSTPIYRDGAAMTLTAGWHQFVLARQAGLMTLYFDGSLIATAAAEDATAPVALANTWGQKYIAGLGSLKIGEMRCYSHVLTADDVAHNWNARKSVYGL